MITMLEEQLRFCKYEADKYCKASVEGRLPVFSNEERRMQYRLGPKRAFARTAAKSLHIELEFRACLIKMRHCE
jgi:hypothetical protein